jgi:Cytochrome c554 and c-prime
MRQRLIESIAAIALLSLPLHAQTGYVGVRTCARCHSLEEQGNAFLRWQTSKHAEAYGTLKTHSESEARKCQGLELWIAEIGRGVKYGLPRRATESKECLPCHTTAFGVDAHALAPSFDPTDGVQCESCHGPGSAHAEAMAARSGGKGAAGLRRYEDERAIQAQCKTCHEGTCGDFDFATMWPKVQHSSSRGH